MELDKLSFSAQGGYPTIGELLPNANYARWMLDNVGGNNSEMTAIALYLYNHLLEEEYYPQVAFIFERIAMVEMKHLKIFATLARKLGADPRLWTCEDQAYLYWTPSYNEHYQNFHQLICYALDSEWAAIKKYEYQKSMIDEPTICNCLERIIEDELVHVKLFNMILENDDQLLGTCISSKR